MTTMGLMQGAIKFGQCEHIQSATSLKEIWNCFHQLYVTQRQNTSIYYYFQELYLKKWDKCWTILGYS